MPEDEKTKIEEIQSALPVISPDAWIGTAIDKGMSIDVLERLFVMKKEYDIMEAKKAFDEAMALFQSKCPIIKKVKPVKNKEGEILYSYAPIEAVLAQKVSEEDNRTVKELIADCGFSYIIKTDVNRETNRVTTTCAIKHIRGHSEESVIELPYIKQTQLMSDSQQVVGTRTMGMRISFSDAFAIMTMDEDTDGVTNSVIAEYDYITKDWQFKEAYIQQVVETIRTKSAFRKFCNTLPTEEQTAKFIKILIFIKPEQQRKFWISFQKQTNESADKFLADIEKQLATVKK